MRRLFKVVVAACAVLSQNSTYAIPPKKNFACGAKRSEGSEPRVADIFLEELRHHVMAHYNSHSKQGRQSSTVHAVRWSLC